MHGIGLALFDVANRVSRQPRAFGQISARQIQRLTQTRERLAKLGGAAGLKHPVGVVAAEVSADLGRDGGMQRIDERLQRLGVLVPERLFRCRPLLGEELEALQGRQGLRLKSVAELANHLIGRRVGNRDARRRNRRDRRRLGFGHAQDSSHARAGSEGWALGGG